MNRQISGDRVMPILNHLTVFADTIPRGGPEQMALDEALLETWDCPVLRIYHWEGPAVSFGYSQSLAEVRQAFPGLPLVRRWTGGGIVEHGKDWTFSLTVPAGEPFATVRPAESYRQIHAVIAAALGREMFLKTGTPAGLSLPGACFVQPVRDDVLTIDGRKVCGGAQRRTRKGFLHQGSVQNCTWPCDLADHVAGRLSARIETAPPPPSLLERARKLAEEKYGSPEWTTRNP